jgi:hypothetical protein
MKLDYTIKDPQERKQIVEALIAQKDDWTPRELDKLANYLIYAIEKHENEILTENRMVTINKRETSYQGLSEKLEGGEDSLHNLMRSDKNMILTHKTSISTADLNEVPDLGALRMNIERLETLLEDAQGAQKYRLKKMIIEMRKEQYTLRNLYRQPIYSSSSSAKLGIQKNDDTLSDLRFDDPKHVFQILNNYSKLKQHFWDKLNEDMRWALIDLENIIDKYIKDQYPLYYDLLVMKADGYTNNQIQQEIEDKYGRRHSHEYISSLWCNKIPYLIADGFKEDWLNWVYTYKMKGNYKTCSRCGQTKLAHTRYFTTNKTAQYGFYSICKECRNK